MWLLPRIFWLEALGWTIINSWWQFGILWVIWLLIQKIWPRINASLRTNIALTLLLSGAAWFIAGFIGRCLTMESSFIQDQAPLLTNQTEDSTRLFSVAYLKFLTATYLMPLLSTIYLSWMVVQCWQLVFRYRALEKLEKEGLQKAPVAWRLFCANMRQQLQLPHPIQVWVSDQIEGPLVMGWLKPMILIPVAAVNQLSSQQLEAILLHELAHIKRNDYLWNWIIQVTGILLFFNPFARLFIEIIQEEREHACDDLVLQFPFRPQQYAQALLTLEKARSSQHHGMVLAANGNNRPLLLNRVKRILNMPQAPASRKPAYLIYLILSVGIWITIGSSIRLAGNSPKTNLPVRGTFLSGEIGTPFSGVGLFDLDPESTASPASSLIAANPGPETGSLQGTSFVDGLPFFLIPFSKNETTTGQPGISLRKPLQQEVEISRSLEINKPLPSKSIQHKQPKGFDTQSITLKINEEPTSTVSYEWVGTIPVSEATVWPATARFKVEGRAFTFDNGQQPVVVPEEASPLYNLPYVPQNSFERAPILDTLPLNKTQQEQQIRKAREAALQTQLALEKLNWDRLKQLANESQSKVITGQEFQALVEDQLAQLNWQAIQAEAKSMLKQLDKKDLQQLVDQHLEIRESYERTARELREMNQQLQKVDKELKEAVMEKSKELRKKEEQLLKKQKTVHI